MEQLYYKYVKMDLEQFAVFEENIPQKLDGLKFQTQVQFDYDKAQNVLCCKITITFSEDGKPLMKAVMCSYFSISKDSLDQIRNEQDQFVFAPYMLIQFSSLNYGSLRGVLYLKRIGTKLAEHILPPIYFGQIIDKPFVVE